MNRVSSLRPYASLDEDPSVCRDWGEAQSPLDHNRTIGSWRARRLPRPTRLPGLCLHTHMKASRHDRSWHLFAAWPWLSWLDYATFPRDGRCQEGQIKRLDNAEFLVSYQGKSSNWP